MKAETLQVIGDLVDLLVPDFEIPIVGYTKKDVIKTIKEESERDPIMTKLRLMTIYTELKKLVDNGGLL